MAHSHEKPSGCSRSSHLHVYDRRGVQEIIVGGKLRGITVFTQQYIYVPGSIFVKLANEFYPNIYHLAVYLRL